MSNQEIEMRLGCLEKKMDFLVETVTRLAEAENMRIMNVDDIARMLNMPKPTLYHKRWLLPNFGASEGKMEWTKLEVLNHLARGTEELYREFVALGKEKASQKIGSL